MSEKYTPDYDYVEGIYLDERPVSFDVAVQEFASFIAQVKAEALEEAAQIARSHDYNGAFGEADWVADARARAIADHIEHRASEYRTQ